MLVPASATTHGLDALQFDTTVTERESPTSTYAYTANTGSVTVDGTPPVPSPAPSTFVLLAIGAAVVAAVRLRRAPAGGTALPA